MMRGGIKEGWRRLFVRRRRLGAKSEHERRSEEGSERRRVAWGVESSAFRKARVLGAGTPIFWRAASRERKLIFDGKGVFVASASFYAA